MYSRQRRTFKKSSDPTHTPTENRFAPRTNFVQTKPQQETQPISQEELDNITASDSNWPDASMFTYRPDPAPPPRVQMKLNLPEREEHSNTQKINDQFNTNIHGQEKIENNNELNIKTNDIKSVEQSVNNKKDKDFECVSKVEVPMEFVYKKNTTNLNSNLSNQSENLTSESRTKSKRKGNAGILSLYCARARQNTFVYGSIQSYYNPIVSWFIETTFSDGKIFATTNTTFPTFYVKFDFIYPRPLSWAQILTAYAEGPLGTMRMANKGMPLETSCPSRRDDEGGNK